MLYKAPEYGPVKSRKDAQAKAEHLVARLELTRPIDVMKIADALGIRVVKVKDPGTVDLSGALVVQDGVPTILVNSGHSEPRMRFTVAHEIGHALMHAREGTSGVLFRDAISARGTSIREIQANAFAASVLMPKEEVMKYFPQPISLLWSEIIKEEANEFRVSAEALTFRLMGLNLVAAE